MKPLTLKIEGINSFNKEQTIDFSKLTDKGVFGIFGATGTGKSSIIDAITLALYGKINRYDGKVGYKEFININCENAKVYFEFCIKHGKENVFYSITRHFKKVEGASPKTTLVRLTKNNQIISDKISFVSYEVEKIIGLNYSDFSRAVVLPQGKFSEFLMLENKEKRSMLERIFGLEKYGLKLSEKINYKRKEQFEKVQKIEEKIKFYGEDVTLEKLEEIEQEYKTKKIKLENIKTDLNLTNKICQQLENDFNLKNELDNFIKQKNKLDEYFDFVENMKKDLQNAKNATIIYPYVVEGKSLKDKIENLNIEINKKYETIKQLDLNFNNIKQSYEKLKTIRQDKEPKLLNLKINLQECVHLNDEINSLKNIINQYQCEKIKILNKKNELEQNVTKSQNLVDLKTINLNKILEFKSKNKINPQYKDDIECGYELEKNLEELDLKILKNKYELEKLKPQIEQKNTEKQKIFESLESFKNKNLLEQQKLNTLEQKPILTVNELNELKESIVLKQNFLENLLQKQNDKEQLKNKIFKIEKEIEFFNQNLDSLKNDKKEKNNKLEDISTQLKIKENKDLINILSKSLIDGKECPICGSINHPNPAKVVVEQITNNLEILKQDTKKDLKNIENEILNIENEKIKKEVSVENLKTELNNILNILKNNNIKENKNILKKLQNNYQKQSLDFDNINLQKQKLNKIILDYNNKINELNIEFVKIDENLKNLRYNYDNIKKENDLYKKNFLKLEIDLKIKLKNFKIESFSDEFLKIKNILTKLNKNQEQEDFLKNEIEIEKNKITNNLNNILKIEKDSARINAELEGKQSQIINLTKKISKYLKDKNKDIHTYLKEVNDDLQKIAKDEEEKFDEFKKLELRKFEEEKFFESLKTELLVVQKSEKQKNIQLQEQLKKFDFKTSEDIEKALLTDKKMDYLENKIKSYDNKKNNTLINIKRLKKQLEKVSLNDIEEQLKINKKNLDKLKNEEQELIQNLTKLSLESSQIKKNIKDIKQLIKIKKDEVHKLDLLTELSKINQGGVFVEYIAANNLRHIVLDASLRLKTMTNGKFSIHLKNSDFIIKDYFNGDVERSPKSLSGGEVFIVSLSLALALSNKIQLKNKAPLEVFFLDEGFGTLDNNLLDIVISSLENLQSQQVSVGVITHVEEIKNRIETKVTVSLNKNDFEGAKILLN